MPFWLEITFVEFSVNERAMSVFLYTNLIGYLEAVVFKLIIKRTTQLLVYEIFLHFNAQFHRFLRLF